MKQPTFFAWQWKDKCGVVRDYKRIHIAKMMNQIFEIQPIAIWKIYPKTKPND